MKCTSAIILATLISVSAFAPQQQSVRSTVAQNALADRIFGMDLFTPVKDQNNYGARKNKNLKVGKITEKSYIPNGLSKAEYEKIRAADQAKKDQKYQSAVSKAFKYQDFTEWYAKRGTELNQGWKKAVTLGHTMAKTKYDWSGTSDAKKFESTKTDGFAAFGVKKPVVAAKKAPAKPAAPKKKFIY